MDPVPHDMFGDIRDMEFSINRGTPIAGWFINVYFMENPLLIFRGTPISGNLHMNIQNNQ